jgi:superoxide dismutase, Fe-Mn family
MSCETVMFHFSLHQRGCIERAAALVRGTKFELLTVEELIHATSHAGGCGTLYHYAAEAWSHEFFWKSMRPAGSGAPRGLIGACIRREFGTYRRFVRSVQRAADALLGNGWLWLTWSNGKLQIVTTSNAGTPHRMGHTPLLALDLWEHAYYLDHQNRRSAYVAAFLEELANWELAGAMLDKQIAATPTRAARKSVNVAALVADASEGVTHHAATPVSAEYPGARRNPQAACAGESRGVRQLQ